MKIAATSALLVCMGCACLFAAENNCANWTEEGYADFADGQFGNGGQNLYVSAAGVLQRVFHFDYNKDGYVDLLYVNAHDMNERAPVFVYQDPLGKRSCSQLVDQGAYTGAIADLNADGFDDLVIANQNNGTHSNVAAYVYYGSSEGLDERRKVELPAPDSKAVAVGDFNGDGLPDVAFGSGEVLRIFYQQEGRCFMPGKMADHPMIVPHLSSADIDGDGFDDLYARVREQAPRILWGGPDGINPERITAVGGVDATAKALPGSTPGWMHFARGWRPRVVKINKRVYLYRNENNKVYLYPVQGRVLQEPSIIDCPQVTAVAAGDVNCDGHDDIALAVDAGYETKTQSWLYWGTDKGFDSSRRVAVPTQSARDVAIEDIDGDVFPELIVCQGRTDLTYDTQSLIFKGSARGLSRKPVSLPTHDATTVLVGHTCSAARPDVIFINHCTGRMGGDVSAFIYWGGKDGFKENRRSELPGRSAADAQNCDFNDDGWTDILICNNSENAPHLDPGSFIYWGGPNGFSTKHRQVLPTVRNWGSAVGDFRRCGYLDLALSGFHNPELLVFRNGAQGFDLEQPQRILMDPALTQDYRPKRERGSYTNDEERGFKLALGDPRWLASADYNRDGRLDLFVSQIRGPQSFILWGSPRGFSWDNRQALNLESGENAHAADLNGNGWLDLVVGGYNCPSKTWPQESYVYVYWGGPQGYHETRRMQLPANAADSMTIADFNNDGCLDIFSGSYSAGRRRDCDSFIYWGAAGGRFSEENFARLFTHSACGCIAADFDENGFVDLAVASHRAYGNHVAKSQVWWNGPKGFSEQKITELPTRGPHGMLTAPVGNILDRGNEEFYVSNAQPMPPDSRVSSISWEADCPAKTWVRAQVRCAEAAEGLVEAVWRGPSGPDSWFRSGEPFKLSAPKAGWVQYKLALGATNGGCTPRVRKVVVSFSLVD